MFAVCVLTLRNVLTYLLYDCDKIMLLQNFTTGGLSSLLHFNFVQDFMIYLCTFVTNAVKNFACGGVFLHLFFYFFYPFFLFFFFLFFQIYIKKNNIYAVVVREIYFYYY